MNQLNVNKTLKNVHNTTLRSFSSISTNQISVTNLSAGNISLPFLTGNVLTGVQINDSFIDNTIIGSVNQAAAYVTTLISGTAGVGYPITFNSNTVGDTFTWNPNNSTANIAGTLIVRDLADIGNLRIIGNNLQAINTGGNVNIIPNGTGIIYLDGSVTQTSSGNSSFNNSGTFTVNSLNTTLSGDLVNITSTSNINLSPTNSVIIPTNISLYLGNSYLKENINLQIHPSQDLDIKLTTGKSINIPTNTYFKLGTSQLSNNVSGLLISGSSTTISGNLNTSGLVNFSGTSHIDIGYNSIPDIYDRGISFLYNTGTPALGFFGYKNSNSRFVVYRNASVSGNVYSGTLCDLEVGTIYSNSVDIGYGSITNVQNISGPSLNITGTPDLFLTASRYIYLQAGQQVKIPDSIPLTYGVNNITGIGNNLYLNPVNSIFVPSNKKLTFDGNNSLKYISSGSTLDIYSDTSLRFNISSGAIYIPQNISTIYGLSTQSITGSSTELSIESSGNINLLSASGSIFLTNAEKIIWGTNTEYIVGSSGINIHSNISGSFIVNGNLDLTSTNLDINLSCSTINLHSSISVNILDTIPLVLGSSSNIKSLGSNLNISTNILQLNASTSINVPNNKPVVFGNAGNNIVGITNILQISGNNQLLLTAPLVTVSGNLEVEGTLTYINSTVTTIIDPVIQLGDNTVNDFKDRGISFLHRDSGVPKIGFLGWKGDTGHLTYIPDAIESTNIFTGIAGILDIGQVNCTGVNLNNGSITNVNNIQVSSLTGNQDIRIYSRDTYLSSTGSIIVPTSIPIIFSSPTNYISSTGTTFTIGGVNLSSVFSGNITQSCSNIYLQATTSVNIPTNIPLIIGSTIITSTTGNTSIINSSNITISNSNLYLNSSTSINIPINIPINIGSSQIIESNTNLTINSNSKNIVFSTTSGNTITIPTNVKLNFGNINNYIYYNGTNLIISSPGTVTLSTNLSVSGNLILSGIVTSGTWRGSVITLPYGGTGKSSWLPGSVVFSDTSTLQEDNTNFFWDKINKRLGLGTNTPKDRLSIIGSSGVSPLLESDSVGYSYLNSTGNYNIRLHRVTTGSGFNADFYISTGNNSNVNSLTPRFIIDGVSGEVGINFTNTPSILYPLHVNGHIGTTGNLHFSSTEYIEIVSNALVLHSNTKITIQTNIPLTFGTNNSIVNNVLDNLVVTSSNNIYLNPLLFVNIPVNKRLVFGSSLSEYIYSDAINDLYIVATGNVHINIPVGKSFILPYSVAVQFGTTGATITGDTSNNLSITNNNLILNSSVGVSLPPNIPLHIGSIGSVLQGNTSGSVSLTSSNILNLSGTSVNIPDNIPLVFGNISRRIESDGNNLNIYGNNQVVFNVPDVTINGNLNVSGNITYVTTNQIVTDSTILVLGDGHKNTIVSITNGPTNFVNVTVSASHGLVTGDSVIITNTNSTPVIDGTYLVTVISSVIFRISFTGGLTVSGSTGIATSSQISNINKDIGIQLNWHDNTTGTAGSQYGFFGFKRSSQRWVFITSGTNTGDVFSGGLGNIEISTLYSTNIAATSLSGTLTTGSQIVVGTNFSIGGGTINNTPIGNITPASGIFSNLSSSSVSFTGGSINNTSIGSISPSSGSFTTLSVSSSALVTNLNANYLNGKSSGDFILRDGTTPLIGNWNSGSYTITSANVAVSSLSSGNIVYTGSGGLLSVDTGFSYITGTLTVTNINSFNLSGTISGGNVTGANINNSSITLSPTNTFDASLGSVIFSPGQINAASLYGTGSINITGNSNTVTNGIYTTNYVDNSILKCDISGTVTPLVVNENTIIGRKAGGVIASLSSTEVRNILNIVDVTPSNVEAAGAVMVTGSSMTGSLNYSYENLNFTGGSTGSPTTTANISYISVTGTGICSGNMPVPSNGSIGGQWHLVILDNISPGCSYNLAFSAGELVTPDGNTSAKTISMTSIGESIEFIWSPLQNRWCIRNSGITNFV